MDWGYVRVWGMILVLVALGAALVWGLGYAVYLNRIGSRGWASTRRLLVTALVVFALALPLAVAFKEGATMWTLAKGRLGSSEGQYQTGILYAAGGTFLRTSRSKAVYEFRLAAEQGHAQAQFALAQACHSGQGTPKDRAEALRWARAAAQADHPLAIVLAGSSSRNRPQPRRNPFSARPRPCCGPRERWGMARPVSPWASCIAAVVGSPRIRWRPLPGCSWLSIWG